MTTLKKVRQESELAMQDNEEAARALQREWQAAEVAEAERVRADAYQEELAERLRRDHVAQAKRLALSPNAAPDPDEMSADDLEKALYEMSRAGLMPVFGESEDRLTAGQGEAAMKMGIN